jgi:dihydroflavonol-4-reductase
VTASANSPQRILVTGGSGFIGSNLAQLGALHGHVITVVTAVNNAAERARCDELGKAGVELVVAPLEDARTLARVMRSQDAVIHLAAAQHEAERPESYFHQVNVEGTRHLLELASQAGVRRFVHGSTIGVYGSAAAGTLDESSPLAPDNPYGRTKVAAESVVRNAPAGMEFCIIRISETYGPGDMRLLKLFRAIGSGRYVTVGAGENEHQLIYVEDLARGLLAACGAPKAAGQTIVLAGCEHLTTNAMVAAISAAVRSRRRIRHSPMWPFVAAAFGFEKTFAPLGLKPPLHRRRLDFFRKSFRFSTSAAEGLLNFRPEIDFAEGARRTAEWYRSRAMLA